MNYSAGQGRCGISLWALEGLKSSIAVSSVVATGTLSPLVVPDGGLAFAVTYGNYGTGVTWGKLNSDNDVQNTDSSTGLNWSYSAGSYAYPLGYKALSIGVTMGGAWADRNGLAISLH